MDGHECPDEDEPERVMMQMIKSVMMQMIKSVMMQMIKSV